MKARWPDGFRCPRCIGHVHCYVYGRRINRYQCRSCGHQATLTARLIMQFIKLPLTGWFMAFYLIGQSKHRISSLKLSRHLGINYAGAGFSITWFCGRCASMRRPIFCRERSGWMMSILAEIPWWQGRSLIGEQGGGRLTLDNAGHPRHVKLATVATFSVAAIGDWAQDSLAIGNEMISDDLPCLHAVNGAG